LTGFAALALLAPGVAQADTFTINSETDLRMALTNAQNGDTVSLNANVQKRLVARCRAAVGRLRF
jgi:hypothetical protein